MTRRGGVAMRVMKVIQARWARRMAVRVSADFLGAMVVTACVMLSAPLPSASAQPCPDIEVVFARGTGEPPGVGGVGQAFVDALQSQVGAKSVGVYGVDYAASS